MRWLATLILLAVSAVAHARQADQLVVDKSERTLYVYADGKVIARYPVALGLYPVGPKQREGDRKTPEGRYTIDYKKRDSAFFRALHISYPNADDVKRAKRQGVSPGGAIMIHGQPNDPRVRKAVRLYPFPDWTDGCIALSNADMEKLWAMVRVPVGVEIRP